jgi:hypothetical protein
LVRQSNNPCFIGVLPDFMFLKQQQVREEIRSGEQPQIRWSIEQCLGRPWTVRALAKRGK